MTDMTEADFFAALVDLLQRYPHYDIARDDQTGDITFRRRSAERATVKGQVFAQAIRGIMSADGKKPRGGGWT